MTKDQIKRLAKVLVPVLLAVGATFGYVDQNCSCQEAPASAPPAALDAPDAG